MLLQMNSNSLVIKQTSHNWMDPHYVSITWLAPGVETNK